jgi:hypothetical protein
MSKFYHGTDKLFDQFEPEYSGYSGSMWLTPCWNLALSYAVGRTGTGYVYEVEYDELGIDSGDCGCIEVKKDLVDKIKIISSRIVDVSECSGRLYEAECGRMVILSSNSKFNAPK